MLRREISVLECAPQDEPWPMSICRSCVAKRDSKELMLHSAFSKS